MSTTPGPWRIDRDSRPGYEWNLTIADAAVDVCFMCHDLTPENETGEANARLIVSAPDLLDALRELKRVVMADLLPIANKHGGELWMADALRIDAVFQMTDAAIAKAEGR